MKRVFCAVLVGAATLASCTDIPVGLETGGIAFDIHVVRAVPISISGAPAADGAGTSQSTDSARIRLSGPGGTTSLTTTPGGTVRFDSLAVGTYSAVLEAFSGDALSHSGSVTGIEVVAGQTASTTDAIVLPTEIEFTALGAMIQLDGPAGTTWASSNDAVATVDASGIVTSTGNGAADISASLEGSSGEAIALVGQQVASVTVTPGASTIAVGATEVFDAEAFDSLGAEIDDLDILWVSSNHLVATIEADGTATGFGPGTATITAAIGGQPGSADLTVDPVPATQLAWTVQPGNANRYGVISPSVRVEIQDASGNRVAGATDAVELTFGADPTAGTAVLMGTRIRTAVDGVAVFDDLASSRAGVGYTLSAAATGLTGAESDAFEVGSVALLANTTYVNYIPGNTGAEASNLEQTYIALGADVTTFTDISAVGINTALAGARVLAIPEQEAGSLDPALDPARRTAIATWVDQGGTFAIWGSSFDATLLNGIFGLSLANSGIPGGPNTRVATGAIIDGAPDVIGSPSATYTIDDATLPPEAIPIYVNDASSDIAVFVMPVGSGWILYMGWDWFDAPPVGFSPEDGWVDVLRRMLGL